MSHKKSRASRKKERVREVLDGTFKKTLKPQKLRDTKRSLWKGMTRHELVTNQKLRGCIQLRF